jgi:hypothetical protein
MNISIKPVFLAYVFLMVFLYGCSPFATPVSPTVTPSPVPPTATPTATPTFTPEPTATRTPRPTPTRAPLTLHGVTCIPWTSITKKDIDKNLCIYGIVYGFEPSYNKWYTVTFSSDSDSFRIFDFNYYYLTPIHKGDCILAYGRIRDWGPFLIISPDYKSEDKLGVGDGKYCQ